MSQVQVLETLTVVTPFGLRFWDVVMNRPVTEGLTVVMWPVERPEEVKRSSLTRSGFYTFRWLSGMRPVEHDYVDPEFFDASLPGRRRFAVHVRDRRQRFLPVAFEVALPLPYRGVYMSDLVGSLPEQSPPGVHLFSTPVRPLGASLTAVRGTLLDVDSGTPAAWARVHVSAAHGQEYHGVADEAGRFAVVFPFPSLEQGFGGSPAAFGSGTPIGDRQWDLTLSVSYEPSRLQSVNGTPLPEYHSVLEQGPGTVWTLSPASGGVPQSERAVTLSFHHPAVLHSVDEPVQYVSPLSSIP